MHGLKQIAVKILKCSLERNTALTCLSVRKMSSQTYNFETLKVTSPREDVAHVELNRPDKLNAMNKAFWRECRECFERLAEDSNYRVVVLSGSGRLFTAGLDLTDVADILMTPGADVARNAFKLKPTIYNFQESFSSIEKCPKPVIAAVHGACVGGGLDMTSACDIRYCTQDAWFQVKEIDLGMTADVGTLQRLPKVIGNDSIARELCYTGRKFHSDEAKEIGYVSRIFPDKSSMMDSVLDLASNIASKSPVAVQGTKISLVYSRDHSVSEGLQHVALWNSSMIQSEDLMKAVEGSMQKKQPKFSKL